MSAFPKAKSKLSCEHSTKKNRLFSRNSLALHASCKGDIQFSWSLTFHSLINGNK